MTRPKGEDGRAFEVMDSHPKILPTVEWTSIDAGCVYADSDKDF